MRLLIITRKVNNRDPRVGFFSEWVDVFSKLADSVLVITWQESSSEFLPKNVRLISLSGNKFKKIALLKLTILRERKNFDAVFIHMMPEYVLISGPLLRLLGKRISLWYTHKAVTFKRRISEVLVHTVFTASEKSFRRPLFKKKINIIGHGIATEHFQKIKSVTNRTPYSMITVNRISTSKDIETMIKAIYLLRKEGLKEATLTIVGAPAIPEDAAYYLALQQMVKNMELELKVVFRGPVPYELLPQEYQKASIAINLSRTGSLDKTILEGMLSGCIIITSNEAVKDIIDPRFYISRNDAGALVKAIHIVAKLSDKEKNDVIQKNRKEVLAHHSLDALITKILRNI